MRARRFGPGKAADIDAKFKLEHLSRFLDTLVAMRWDLSKGLDDGADLPKVLTDQVRLVDANLDAAIRTVKLLILQGDNPALWVLPQD